MIALELSVFFLFVWMALFALGGLVVLLLPREWRSYTVVLAPLVGYALLLLIGYYAVRTVLNLYWAFWVALALALLVAVWIEWRRRRERRIQGKTPTQAARESLHPLRSGWEPLGLSDHWPALLLALAAILLAVLPLLSYGYSVPIGENWDPENYVPIAAYLQQVAVGRIVEMPPNPLRDMNAFPPRIGMTLGFCIVQGTLGRLVAGWDALAAFAPTIALLYGLTALAFYALFRVGFGMGGRAGLIATALSGLSALALWIAFFNFGMQMAAMPLVPLALTLWLLVLRQPSWRTVLLAGLAVAALPVAYYPALTVFVPVALGLGLYEVVRRWTGRDAPAGQARPEPELQAAIAKPPTGVRRTVPVFLAGLATAALAVILAIGPILDYGQGFSFRYGQQMTTLGLFDFPALAQVVGLEPFSRTPEALPAMWSSLATAALFLAVAAAGAALLSRRPLWPWLAALVPALLYLAWLRGWFLPLVEALRLPADLLDRFRPYPYAFLKGAVFVVPFFWGVAVANWERLLAFLEKRPGARAWRIALVGVLILPLGLVLAADAHLVARYWGRPAHFDAQAMAVQEAASFVPAGEEVYLTGRPERSRVLLGLFSYFLLEHPVQGRFSTGYGGYDRRLPGAEPNYALLDADDDPLPLGFFPTDRIWAGGGMALYRRNAAIVSFLDLRSDAYTGRDPGEIHTKEPLAERLLQSFGPYPAVTADQPLLLYADGHQLSRRDGLVGIKGLNVLAVAFASFEPATLTLRWADGTSDICAIEPGFSVCFSRLHDLPGYVTIAPQNGVAVWPLWALMQGDTGEIGVHAVSDEVVLLPEAAGSGSVLDVGATVHNASGRPLRLSLEVWENTFDTAHHYAWWGPLPLPESGTLRLRVDLAARTAQAWVGEQETPFVPHPGADAWPAAADGSYFAALWVYYGGQVVEVLPVGRFTVSGGQVQGLAPIPSGLRLVWPHSPSESGGARFGPAVELSAYERGTGPFSPGDAVPLALEWHALDRVPVDYSVTAQILKDGRLWGQWDGPLGQWITATFWHPGQFVRDDIPLRVSDDASPGSYRLIVAVYDPATGVRLPVRSAEGRDVGDFLDLGEIVIR